MDKVLKKGKEKMDINKIIMTGSLSRVPQQKQTNSGKTVASLSIQVEKMGGYSFYMDVDAWGRTAESVMQFTTPGIKLYIEGRIEVQSWTDQTTQAKKSKPVLVADYIAPLSAMTAPASQQYNSNSNNNQGIGGYGQPQNAGGYGQPQHSIGSGFGAPYTPPPQQNYQGAYQAQISNQYNAPAATASTVPNAYMTPNITPTQNQGASTSDSITSPEKVDDMPF